jgi:hypothetical protein
MNNIIEKIQKLLSLANSDNEHEAKNATRMANELLLKYNLSLQQIDDHESEYIAEEVASTGLTLNAYQKQIAQLLIEFFFVRVIISKKHVGFSSGQYATYKPVRAQYKKTIQLVGTKENCKIAGYIFSYLNTAYPHLWKDYFDRNTYATQKQKISYFTGLTHGIAEMLRVTKWKVQNETGLVLKRDPKLDEFVKKRSGGTYGSDTSSKIDPVAFKKGVEDGAKVTLRKPIESQATQSNRFLTNDKPK